MKIVYGTTNQGKINQVKDFFQTQKVKLEILSLKDIGFDSKIIENGKTIQENARIKAKAIASFCKKHKRKEIVVADDTGLCVDALGGRPGVYSARYAGEHAKQEVVLAKLLDEMKQVPEEKRTAHFICVLVAILPNEERIEVTGRTEGKIALTPGQMGKLTYGPIFIPDGFHCVMNELKDEQLATTHREKAFLELLEKLEQTKE